MAFLNIPIKAIQGNMTAITAGDTMPWYNPTQFPLPPGTPTPTATMLPYRWIATIDIAQQLTSSYITRNPGIYDGQDVQVGQWIANTASGAAWQIISVIAKTTISVTVEVQDVCRYNTFRDPSQVGNGSPPLGYYVIFNISDSGVPQIDPIPEVGTSAVFYTNLQSRFEYINLQYDYPLYQAGNTFQFNDVIATDASSHSFVEASDGAKIPVGRITSISDTIPGWFTLNPVQKIVDFLDALPGDVGDIIYTDITDPGQLTLTPGGSQIYLKLRNQTPSITYSGANATTTVGNVFQLNGIDVTLASTADLTDLVNSTNLVTSQTGVTAVSTLTPVVIQTSNSSITPTYGEPLLSVTSPAVSSINGVSVTFNIASTSAGYVGYTRAADMATSINNANIPNITAVSPDTGTLQITNSVGGAINIVNITADSNGIYFAGTASGAGLPITTPASSSYYVQFTAVDSRAIDFLDVTGSPVEDYGLISVENGIKACGMYIAEGLRTATSTVVANLSQLNALSPLIGDQAYVIDSNDGNGNNVGEWSQWLYNGSMWVKVSSQESSTTDAKSLEYMLLSTSPSAINIGGISTGRRITLITVEVTSAFIAGATLAIGYTVNNPTTPVSVTNGLMDTSLIDLTVIGTYTTSTDVLFGTDTVQGDVEITAAFVNNSTTTGAAQIIVSYV